MDRTSNEALEQTARELGHLCGVLTMMSPDQADVVRRAAGILVALVEERAVRLELIRDLSEALAFPLPPKDLPVSQALAWIDRRVRLQARVVDLLRRA